MAVAVVPQDVMDELRESLRSAVGDDKDKWWEFARYASELVEQEGMQQFGSGGTSDPVTVAYLSLERILQGGGAKQLNVDRWLFALERWTRPSVQGEPGAGSEPEPEPEPELVGSPGSPTEVAPTGEVADVSVTAVTPAEERVLELEALLGELRVKNAELETGGLELAREVTELHNERNGLLDVLREKDESVVRAVADLADAERSIAASQSAAILLKEEIEVLRRAVTEDEGLRGIRGRYFDVLLRLLEGEALGEDAAFQAMMVRLDALAVIAVRP